MPPANSLTHDRAEHISRAADNSARSCSNDSRPTEIRTSSSRIPIAARAEGDMKRCDVDAGCDIVVRASASVGANGIDVAARMNVLTTSTPLPASSSERMPPVPSGYSR